MNSQVVKYWISLKQQLSLVELYRGRGPIAEVQV